MTTHLPLALTVNGEDHHLMVEPRRTLLDLLRHDLGLTGAKKVCNMGNCGACTVMVDGRTVYACLTLAIDCEGREVRTIEGLADGATLDPVQQAFIEEDAFQCGYCTPGQVMSMRALLDENPEPTERRHRSRGERQPLSLRRLRPYRPRRPPRGGAAQAAGIGGGRMTSFSVTTSQKDGKLELGIEEHAPNVERWETGTKFSTVGTSARRLEAIEKVTGRAQYSSDVRLPRQTYAKVLRSPYPHAKIVSIDATKAEALPGVVAVIHKDNTDRIGWYDGSAVFPNPVRLIGDEVAAVAAISEEIAEDALRAIEVEYEDLPFVTSLDGATSPGAPRARRDSDSEGNISGEVKRYSRGDPDAGLRQADVVIDDVYTTQAALHNALEPHGCTAAWNGDELTLWDLDAVDLHGSPGRLEGAGHAGAQGARHQAPHGRRLRRQADRLEAGRDRRPAREESRPAGAADAGPRGARTSPSATARTRASACGSGRRGTAS